MAFGKTKKKKIKSLNFTFTEVGITNSEESSKGILTKSQKMHFKGTLRASSFLNNTIPKNRRPQAYLSKIQKKHFGCIVTFYS